MTEDEHPSSNEDSLHSLTDMYTNDKQLDDEGMMSVSGDDDEKAAMLAAAKISVRTLSYLLFVIEVTSYICLTVIGMGRQYS